VQETLLELEGASNERGQFLYQRLELDIKPSAKGVKQASADSETMGLVMSGILCILKVR
jgi:hypothetical protein